MKEFLLPDIGEGIVECEIQRWLVNEGDMVVEDQAVAEVLTDKAAVEISSMYEGKVHKLHYKEGELAKVHEPLFSIIESTVDDHTVDSNSATNHTTTATESKTMQRIPFVLPDIGEGVVECEVVKWHVTAGENVIEDQAVVEVMTDKAAVEIPAKYSGTIDSLCVETNQIAQVGEPLFYMLVPTLEESSGESSGESPVNSRSSDMHTSTEPSLISTEITTRPSNAKPPTQTNHKVLASPAVRRIAREHKIDLAMVTGTGDKGRILKSDIEAAVATETSMPNKLEEPTTLDKFSVQQNQTDVRTEPMGRIQKLMAQQMQKSVTTIPHFTVSDEIAMDALFALRQQLLAEFENKSIKLSMMPLFIKALSVALKDFPLLNARVSECGEKVHYFSHHNIGFAVDSPSGLVVPNIKAVETLSIEDIAVEFNRIVTAARAGKLAPKELSGGTITISNIGVLGGTVATPIINHPESAIVALGKIQTLPRFDEAQNVVAKRVMSVSWSGDHRLLDGATMVRFNNAWTALIEQPILMLSQLK